MATDAIVILEQLRCVTLKNFESRIEPYIWPALLRIDNNTIASADTEAEMVAIVTPNPQFARNVIKDSVQAGETVDIPSSVGILRARFEDNLDFRRLILVVLLFEMDETPESAIEAGFQAFASELRAAVAKKFFILDSAEKSGDEEGVKRIKDEIRKRVDDRVTSAVESSLSAWEKVKIATGLLNLDDFIASAFINFGETPLVPKLISLPFEFKGKTRIHRGDVDGDAVVEVELKLEILGRLQVRPVRSSDRCQPQIDAVNAAQSAVNNIEVEIKNLQAQLSGGGDLPPLPKDFINAEIKRLRNEELTPAELALEKARRALHSCRILKEQTIEPGGVVSG